MPARRSRSNSRTESFAFRLANLYTRAFSSLFRMLFSIDVVFFPLGSPLSGTLSSRQTSSEIIMLTTRLHMLSVILILFLTGPLTLGYCSDPPEPTPTPTATRPAWAPIAPPTSAPTATFTPTATYAPNPGMAEVQVNANCRSGPGMMYDVITWLAPGDVVHILGTYARPDSQPWWLVESPAGPCWVSNIVADVSGDLSTVPEVTPPPTPTPQLQNPFAPAEQTQPLYCNLNAFTEAECGGGIWDGASCYCGLLCPLLCSDTDCAAHMSDWGCMWDSDQCRSIN